MKESSSSPPTVESRYQACREQLEPRGQEHVLSWWGDLTPSAREHLLAEIESIPWDELDPLVDSHVRQKPRKKLLEDLVPPPVFPPQPRPGQEKTYAEATALGEELIRAGKVEAFTVAGGQGTRLGFEGPKGAVTISPVREKTLFQLFAEMMLEVRRRYGVGIRWSIMTSPANHRQTVEFLEDHEFFGLPRGDVVLFSQGVLPSFDFEARILMQDKHRLALAPNGHGGSLKALADSGTLAAMKSRGVAMISYFQVDNPLVQPFDPLFIGLHAMNGSEMSAKVARKVDDLERVGNICSSGGKLSVIEYSDFPEELARARNPDGSRTFDAGNLAIHLLDVGFVDRLTRDGFELPYHRAEKTSTWLDENGFLRAPRSANAVKLESFVFDALPLAEKTLVLEVDRREEFSPVKSAKGVDSAESAIRDQIRRAARWLEAAGVVIPRKSNGEPDVVLEIAASYALSPLDIKARIKQPPVLQPGETIYIS